MSAELAASGGTPADLVMRILAGERRAEEELVRRYSRGVTIIVRRAVKDPSFTEDLCQETLRIAIEKIRRGDVREPDKLSGFISSLARYLAIEHFRRFPRTESSVDPEEVPQLAAPGSNQLSAMLQKERAAAVRQVLKELKPTRDREMLYRFYIAEDDKMEICRDLGLSSLHFNRVLYRARERFRELYEKIAKE